MFTNILRELTFGLKNRWRYVKFNTKIPQKEFLDAIVFIHILFIQQPNLRANLWNSHRVPSFTDYSRYCYKIRKTRHLKDLILVVPNNKINTILYIFNYFHVRLQFTLETQKDNCVNFLDSLTNY